jgi:plasmid replication initiation protein
MEEYNEPEKYVIVNENFKEINEHLVVQDDALTYASYTLSFEEQRLIIAAIEKYHTKKDILPSSPVEVTILAQEYADLFGIKMTSAYKILKKTSEKLYEKTLTIKDEDKKRNIRWLQETAEYNAGKIKLVFSKQVSRFINEVINNQTVYKLSEITKLSTSNAIRLYAMFQTVLEKNKKEGVWVVNIEDLKETLELSTTYPRYADFNRRVIKGALQSINANTTLNVTHKVTKKQYRQPVEITFQVTEKTTEK